MAEQNDVVTIESPEVEKQAVSQGMDEAAEYLTRSSGFATLSAKEERTMVRKMDWILLPMVCSRSLFHGYT